MKSRILLLTLLFLPLAFAQISPLSATAPGEAIGLKRGVKTNVPIKVTLNPGFHCNTNTPSDPYLIPLKLTVPAAAGVEMVSVVYPKGKDEKYSFSPKPVNVYSGAFEIQASLLAAKDAQRGPAKIAAKLRYQACNDSMCFAPKTLEIPIQLLITD